MWAYMNLLIYDKHENYVTHIYPIAVHCILEEKPRMNVVFNEVIVLQLWQLETNPIL